MRHRSLGVFLDHLAQHSFAGFKTPGAEVLHRDLLEAMDRGKLERVELWRCKRVSGLRRVWLCCGRCIGRGGGLWVVFRRGCTRR